MNAAIEHACDDFRAAWNSHSRPKIELPLTRFVTTDRKDLLSRLIRIEIDLRKADGESPAAQDYYSRFPDDVAIVDAAFSETITGLAGTVDQALSSEKGADAFATIASPYGTGTISESRATSPRQIGRYTVLGQLGRGGQADVYRAVHPTLPLEVAIKLTHTALDTKVRDTLREEANILCDLDHPYIARVRDFDFDDGRPFMVLDFIRGRSLAHVAASEPLTHDAAVALVVKLSHAMAYAHSRGVVHRDLKPENIVIDPSGEPKIIDFGMSRLRNGFGGDNRQGNEVSGTLVYMAPEQAVGVTSRTDHRVDIFALGAILYRLLVGKPPYTQSSLLQLVAQVREGQWNEAALETAEASEPLQQICRRAMAADPASRYQNASQLADALLHAKEEQKVSRSPQTRMAISVCLVTLTLAFGLLAMVTHQVFNTSTSNGASEAKTGDDLEKHGIDISDRQPAVTSARAPKVGPLAESASRLINRFDLIHIGNSADRAEFSGSLMEYRAPRENDDIQVKADFTEPVYCYLIAFNPDGVKQLCYPESPDHTQGIPTTQLRYPERKGAAFGLTDGSGQQAFVLYTSRDPLPAFSQWDQLLQKAAWPNPEATGNWAYQHGELTALPTPAIDAASATRGRVRETKTPTPFKELCDRLRASTNSDVHGIMFEVQQE